MLPKTDLFDFDKITDWRIFSLDTLETLGTITAARCSLALKS